MRGHFWLEWWWSFVTIYSSVADYRYGINNPFTNSEFNSTCVDLINVFPVPNTVLNPTLEEALFTDYSFHLWFSHPIKIHTVPIAYLSMSLVLKLFPYYSTYYGESETSMVIYFRVPNELKVSRLANHYMYPLRFLY